MMKFLAGFVVGSFVVAGTSLVCAGCVLELRALKK